MDPDGPTLFNEMKLRAVHKYATFKIKNKKEVVVDEKADPNKTEDKEADKVCFDELKAKMTQEPRYILYDFGFTNLEGRKINKLAFIFWQVDLMPV